MIPPEPLASGPTGRGVALSDNVVLGSGARGSIRLYGAVSDQPKAVLAYRAWEPVAEADNQFQVTAPQISLRTPRGQLVEISATSGMVQLKTMQSERLALSKGKLVGDVEIKIDRLDEQQRAALPPEQRDKPGPDRLITMRLEEVDFDLEYAQLETDGPFHLESAEFDIRLQGLFLRYNELDSSIEELRTESSGRIAVRGMGGMFRVGMPGTEEEPGEADQPEPAERDTEPAAADQPIEIPSADDGVPVLPTRGDGPARVRPAVTYQARFTDDVEVHQLDGGEPTGALLADALEVLFDFGQQQREAARTQAAAPTAAGTTQPAEGTEPAPGTQAGTELTVTWSGPLVITTIEPPADQDPDQPSQERVQVTATGQQVRLQQIGRADATCKKLVFHQESERAWLYGDQDDPVVIETSDGGHLEGPEVVFDTPTGTARISGPGRMWDTRSGPVFATETADGGGPAHRVNIRFAGEVNIAFAQEEAGPTIDGESGAKSESRRQYLEKAVFLGDVLMQQGDDSIAGERIQIDFGPPRREGSLADNMRRLRGEGQVALVQGNESVRCERIDVEMGLDESGRIAPRLARAYSDVSATHEGRTITASDRMIVHLRSFRQQREPFDLNKARAVAMARGH
ncbi:MAG: hypothetical protein ACYSUQ_15370, partial [Planctomycetota bacterium]